jgi:hypothetical protein
MYVPASFAVSDEKTLESFIERYDFARKLPGPPQGHRKRLGVQDCPFESARPKPPEADQRRVEVRRVDAVDRLLTLDFSHAPDQKAPASHVGCEVAELQSAPAFVSLGLDARYGVEELGRGFALAVCHCC